MDTKDKILLHSFKHFMNNGFYHTSMQQLVDSTGLSKGAFYHYFKNKNDLYAEVINTYFLSYYNDVQWDKYDNDNLSLQDVEKEINQFYMNFVPQILSISPKGMSTYFVMYFEAYNLLPDFKAEVTKFYDNLEKLIISTFNDKEKGRSEAVKIIAKYEGILFLLAVKPSLTIQDLLRKVN